MLQPHGPITIRLAEMLLELSPKRACAVLYGSFARLDATIVEIGGNVESLSDLDFFLFTEGPVRFDQNIEAARKYLLNILPMRNTLFHLGVNTHDVLRSPPPYLTFHLSECLHEGQFIRGSTATLQKVKPVTRKMLRRHSAKSVETALWYAFLYLHSSPKGPLGEIQHAYKFAKLCLDIMNILATLYDCNKGPYSVRHKKLVSPEPRMGQTSLAVTKHNQTIQWALEIKASGRARNSPGCYVTSTFEFCKDAIIEIERGGLNNPYLKNTQCLRFQHSKALLEALSSVVQWQEHTSDETRRALRFLSNYGRSRCGKEKLMSDSEYQRKIRRWHEIIR